MCDIINYNNQNNQILIFLKYDHYKAKEIFFTYILYIIINILHRESFFSFISFTEITFSY